MKNFTDFIGDLKNSMKPPSITIFSIMMLYSLIEIFLFIFTGKSLPGKEIMYIILLTWLPFILGNKVSTKTFENSEVVILLILSIFLVLAGVTLKSDDFVFEFHESTYVLVLIIAFFWMLIDLKYFNRIREQRIKEKEKLKENTGEKHAGFDDGMEVD
jgi:hypothetical protein